MAYVTTKPDVQAMFGDIAPRYDITNSALSMGVDYFWRRSLVSKIKLGAEYGLDLCTGTGVLLPMLRSKTQYLVGADFCLPMLKMGKHRLKSGTSMSQADALALPFADNSFDFITAAFGVRNFENTERGLMEMLRVLKPGGEVHILEFGQPRGIFGLLFRFYSNWVMPNVGGLITGNREAYTYLPRTSARFPCGAEFEQKLAQAGFKLASTRALTGGIAWIYRAVK